MLRRRERDCDAVGVRRGPEGGGRQKGCKGVVPKKAAENNYGGQHVLPYAGASRGKIKITLKEGRCGAFGRRWGRGRGIRS